MLGYISTPYPVITCSLAVVHLNKGDFQQRGQDILAARKKNKLCIGLSVYPMVKFGGMWIAIPACTTQHSKLFTKHILTLPVIDTVLHYTHELFDHIP